MGHNRKPWRGDSYSYNITVVFQGALTIFGNGNGQDLFDINRKLINEMVQDSLDIINVCPRSLDPFYKCLLYLVSDDGRDPAKEETPVPRSLKSNMSNIQGACRCYV